LAEQGLTYLSQVYDLDHLQDGLNKGALHPDSLSAVCGEALGELKSWENKK
jgi:hypothetical protein